MKTTLEPPDTHHLSAAIGWLELGNPAEAKAELANLSTPAQQHPDVLDVRWLLHAAEQDWAAAAAIAQHLVERAPERASGWLHRAYALRRSPEAGIEKAWEALLPAVERFPKNAVIAFNLACYACQMQRLDEARLWLKRALKIGGKETIKKMALSDSDLEPLWREITQM